LTIESGKVDITIPPSAFSAELLKEGIQLKLSIEILDKKDEEEKLRNSQKDDGKGLVAVGDTVYEFRSEIALGDKTEKLTNFSTDITVTISMEEVDLNNVDVEKLGVYYYNEVSREWEYVGGRYDPVSKSISFTTTHFSLYTVMKYEKTFKDIANHWAKADIEKMAAKYIAMGKSETNFEPDAEITRAEFTALLVRALGLKDTSANKAPFRDVKEDKWYFSQVNIALEAGIASKRDGVSYRPDISITREEMALMIVRALSIKMQGLNLDDNQVAQKQIGRAHV
jgi:hypothetical protein